jgi:hypothetical protein
MEVQQCGYLQISRNLSSVLSNKDTYSIFRHTVQCPFPFQQNAIHFINLSHLVVEIFTFFEKHAQNLKANSEKFSELGLTAQI